MRSINKKSKLIGAVAIILFLATLLVGCGSIKPIESTEEEAAVVGTIGVNEVRYEELRYIVLNHKKDMQDKYGEDIFATKESAEKYRAELTELVTTSIVSDYYAVLAMADMYYIGKSALMMTEEPILESVQEEIDLAVEECGSKSKYKKMLKESYMTDSLLRFYLAAEACATELFYILVNDLGVIESDEEYIDDYLFSDDFIRTNHIYIEGLSEDNRAQAETLRKQLLESENAELELIMLKGVHCDDYTMTTTHGKYFARYTSDYGDEYELAAFDLREGEISEVVESASGYYVIIRLEPEEDYINRNYEDFKDDILGSEFNKMLATYKSELEFKLNEYGQSIDILEIE